MPKDRDGSTLKESSTRPMPLPYPAVFSAGVKSDTRSHKKKLVSMQVGVFDWLYLNKPDAAPSCLRLGLPLTARQWTAVRMLEHLSFDGNTPNSVDASDMERAAGKVEGLEKSLEAVSRALASRQLCRGDYFCSGCGPPVDLAPSSLRCGEVVGNVKLEKDLTAKPLFADRLTFPEKPQFDPRKFFDSATLRLYDKPLSGGKDQRHVGAPPKVQIRAGPREKLALFKKMAACGLLCPLEDGSYLDLYKNGLFAVPKDAEKDRMVLDGRPANMIDNGQNRWCYGMAGASALSGIYLEPERVLISWGEDLKDYFYQFEVNHERCCRNVLQGSLTLDEAKMVFGKDFENSSGRVTVGLSSLAMGDTCAVEFAQCAHLDLLLQHKVASVKELLSLRGSIPRGLLQVGVMVDDLVILEQVLRSNLSSDAAALERFEGVRRVRKAAAAYASEKLKNNPKKGFVGSVFASIGEWKLMATKGYCGLAKRGCGRALLSL